MRHNLIFVFICGFALLTVSMRTCDKTVKEGDTCTINAPISGNVKEMEIKWTFRSPGLTLTARQKFGQNKETMAGAVIESNGGLMLQHVTLDKTGIYECLVLNKLGIVTNTKQQEITVYEKIPKPNVTFKCHYGSATLTCDVNMTDDKNITITWFKGKESIQVSDKKLVHTLMNLQEKKQYSCAVRTRGIQEKSDEKEVTCTPWVLVTIAAAGGTLFLLLVCFLVMHACQKCKQRQREKDEEELRLNHVPAPHQTVQQRAKTTAKGQPPPPIPREESPHCGPPKQTQAPTQDPPKAKIRARPPPPPPDEEEPPRLPEPRRKHHRRKVQEPYQPME